MNVPDAEVLGMGSVFISGMQISGITRLAGWVGLDSDWVYAGLCSMFKPFCSSTAARKTNITTK